jgi:hypothetical protein
METLLPGGGGGEKANPKNRPRKPKIYDDTKA